MTDLLIAFGGEIKALEDGKVRGQLVVFSDPDTPDLVGDFFTADTDFDFTADGKDVSVFYQHGIDDTLKNRRLGRGTLTKDDVGVWIDAQLSLADDYERAIYELAQAGKLGWSSGALAHLVDREPVGKAWHIKSWHIGEASLTPTPAEPRTRFVTGLKALLNDSDTTQETVETPEATPEAQPSAVDAVETTPVTITVTDIQETTTMSDVTAAPDAQMNEALKALNAQMAEIMKAINESPAIAKSGYVSQTGGKSDPGIKSITDFITSVMTGDHTRLREVYGAQKSLNSETGASGGYVMPTEFSTQLLNVNASTSPILSRVRRIPVSSVSGEFPVLNIYSTPTAGVGQTALAGGGRARTRAESGAYTETEPTFEQLTYRVNDAASGYTKVSREMAQDAPFIESLLRQAIEQQVIAKLERDVLRGTGVGEPLGILTNTTGLVNVSPDTDNTFAYADAVEMYAKFQSLTTDMSRTVWIAHREMIQDIFAFKTDTTGGATQAITNIETGTVNSILNMPIVYSQHSPRADASGCVILADLNAYLLFTRGELYVEFSEHADWLNGNAAWRFGWRCDGKPINRATIKQGNPGTAFESSHFVNFND